jgi:hypothetical protein
MGNQASGTANPYIPMTQTFQELERLKFAQNLRKNPSDYAAYVNTRVDEMSDEVFEQKRAAFQKAQIDLGRYMDMDHNANFYKTRSADVDRLVSSIEENNKKLLQNVKYDKDITRRQFEINEWHNYNKLETLFFLQVFFIASLTGAIIVFLEKNGMITNTLASLLYIILAVIAIGVGAGRYFYTQRTRDTRLWHRRRFPEAAAAKPAPRCDKDGNIKFDVNDIIPKAATECADDAGRRFNKWQENLQQEILNYQSSGGATPAGSASICSVPA